MKIKPPWIHDPHPVFTERGETQGNNSPNHRKYNNYTWQQYSKRFLAREENHICACGCGRLAEVTDHIIPYSRGGSFWDVRNHQPMASVCHNRKSGREAHGKIEEFVGTRHGKIPLRNAKLPAELGNQSYMLNEGLK